MLAGAVLLGRYDRRARAVPRSPRRMVWHVAPLVIALIGVAALLVAISRDDQPAAAACPAGTTQATAPDGYLIQICPERSPVGLLLLHLCTDPSAEAIRHWSLTGTSRAATDQAIAVVAVGQRAGLAAEALPVKELIRLTITVVTASGREHRLTTTADL
jgi:hypothetical protein